MPAKPPGSFPRRRESLPPPGSGHACEAPGVMPAEPPGSFPRRRESLLPYSPRISFRFVFTTKLHSERNFFQQPSRAGAVLSCRRLIENNHQPTRIVPRVDFLIIIYYKPDCEKLACMLIILLVSLQ